MSLVDSTTIGNPPQLDPNKAARIRVDIFDFLNRKEKSGEYFETRTMMAHGYPWKLRIYPRGENTYYDAVRIGCYLFYAADTKDRKEFPVDVRATIRSNIRYAGNISKSTFDGENPSYGIPNWSQRCHIGKEEVLTIDIDIYVDKKRESVWYPTKALKDTTDSKLRRLYSSSKSSDVTFIVGSARKEFNGHKCIIEMSSPYLYGLVLSKAEEMDDVDTAVEATCETDEQKKSEQEGISSDGFVPVPSAEDDDEEDNEDAPAQSTKNISSSLLSSSAPCQPFGTVSTSATSSTAGNAIKSTAAPPFVFGGGGFLAKAPSIYSTSAKLNRSGIPPSSPSNVIIELPDVNEVAFGALFKFLYTGTESTYIHRDEKSAQDMLLLADQFDCTHLKLYAESVLAERFLDTSNAADMILFADAHSCALLKEAAMGIYTTDPKTVKETGGYSRLKESMNLILELLEYTSGERGEYIRVADRTPEEDVDNLDVTSLRERLRSVSIHNVDGSKEMLVKRWKETIA
jgi:hypothetical protein